MKRTLCLCMALIALSGFLALPAFAGGAGDKRSASAADRLDFEDSYASPPPGELILLDALIVRPLSFVGFVIGATGSTWAIWFADSEYEQELVRKQLWERPWDYTFCRPLGDVIEPEGY